jgi:hypothetical protein
MEQEEVEVVVKRRRGKELKPQFFYLKAIFFVFSFEVFPEFFSPLHARPLSLSPISPPFIHS